jgi:hypothetical protein
MAIHAERRSADRRSLWKSCSFSGGESASRSRGWSGRWRRVCSLSGSTRLRTSKAKRARGASQQAVTLSRSAFRIATSGESRPTFIPGGQCAVRSRAVFRSGQRQIRSPYRARGRTVTVTLTLQEAPHARH